MQNPQPKSIGVFGHVGNLNLGDEALIAAVVQNIKQRYPDAQIYGFTLNPEDTQARHKIPAFAIRRTHKAVQPDKSTTYAQIDVPPAEVQAMYTEHIKVICKTIPWLYTLAKWIYNSTSAFSNTFKELRFLIDCYKHLKNIDLLIVAGSQQLIDFIGGTWGHPYTLFKWSILAKVAQTKIAFASVGAGPIASPLSKRLIQCALTIASYHSYRDNSSQKLIERLGVPGPNPIFPDLVYSLQMPKQKQRSVSSSLLVGINPVPFSNPVYWPGSSVQSYKNYVCKLADFAMWIIKRGETVLFFPTQLNLDLPVINDIRMAMKRHRDWEADCEQKIIDWPIASFDDLITALSAVDLVVASRFHGVVIPYTLNKPVIGIAYHKKTFDLMEQMGQVEYALDILSFDLDSLKKCFIDLSSRRSLIQEELSHRISIQRDALCTQYDQLFQLLSRVD
jgi:polysaccharide pyruvyl transferase WcaK-like protein